MLVVTVRIVSVTAGCAPSYHVVGDLDCVWSEVCSRNGDTEATQPERLCGTPA